MDDTYSLQGSGHASLFTVSTSHSGQTSETSDRDFSNITAPRLQWLSGLLVFG
jgi:hypothetical protein